MRRRWQSRLSLLMGSQGGKALKWLSCPFQFWEKNPSSFLWVWLSVWDTLSHSPAWNGSSIYALSADKTSLALAAPRHAITALFSCRSKCYCLSRWQSHFRSNADRAYNTLHFASKVVCQGASPFGNPGQQNRLNISHFPGAWYSAFICCQQPPFRGLRVVPCKLT